jgi:lysophospholipase L1-like esterase
VLAARRPALSIVGPSQRYLAIGDSLAFGYQPDLNYDDGYSNDLYSNLQGHGVSAYANMGCPGETSVTMINGGCPYAFLRKYPYVGAQLNAALAYLSYYAGHVSPVTLDIGANDLAPDINTTTCVVNTTKYASDLAILDANLTQVILPKLHNALMVNGRLTGDLLVMNYYDAYQNSCPNTVSYTQQINQHIANDIAGYATLVDVFDPFGGTTTPNPNLCTYTWICSVFHDIHATDKGYSVVASAFESSAGY